MKQRLSIQNLFPRIMFAVVMVPTFMVQGYSQSQPLNTQPFGIGARATALGGAYISEGWDVSSMYWNPAALSFIHHRAISATVLVRESRSLQHFVALPIQISQDQIVAIGTVGSFTGQPWMQPYFTYYGTDIGLAQKLATTVSIGALVNVRYSSLSSTSLWAAAGSLGFFYSPTPAVSYGIVYNGLGWGINYNMTGSRRYLSYEKSLQRTLQVGATLRIPGNSLRRPDVSIAMASESFLGQNEFAYKAGIEILVVEFLTARIGIHREPDGIQTKGGFGIFTKFFQLDYAMSPSGTSGRFHEVSLAIPWSI